MKKILLIFMLLLVTGSVSATQIVDRGTNDSLNVPFQILDSLGVPVDDATGDSVLIVIIAPSGAEVYSDSMIFSDGRINEFVWEDYGNSYSFGDLVANLDGSSTTKGIYSYILTIHDQSLGLQTPVRGTFQVLTNEFDATLELLRDSIIVILDSLQELESWVAKEASLYDPVTDSVIVDGTIFAGLTDIITSTNIAADAITATGIASNAIGSNELASTAALEISDTTWDEILTGATHNINNSAGKILRQIKGGSVIHDGTSDNVPANTANQFSLETGGGSPITSTTDDFYNHHILALVEGTGAQQFRIISDYTGSNQTVTVTPAFLITPDATTVYEITSGVVHAETQGGGYALGAVWVSPNGTAGTQLYVNGTIDNPIDDGSFADAKTVADALNMSIFRIENGSNITLASTYNNYSFDGTEWTLALGGQDLAFSTFKGASVTGIATGANVIEFFDCKIGAVQLPASDFFNCGFGLNLTTTDSLLATGTGQYVFRQCYSLVSGTLTPVFSMGDAIGNTKFGFRGYDGGMELSEINSIGNDSISIEGMGNLVLNATDIGGELVIRGLWTIDSTTGGSAVNLTRDAALNGEYLTDLTWDEDSTGHYTSPNMAFVASQTGASGGVSDADMAAIGDTVWQKLFDVTPITGSYGDSATGWGATAASSLDSGVVSRVVGRKVWGLADGSGSDSTTLAQRKGLVYSMLDSVKSVIADSIWSSARDAALKSLTVSNSAGDAVQFTSTGSGGDGLQVTGHGAGHGLNALGAASGTGDGIRAGGGGSGGDGIEGISFAGAGTGFRVTGNSGTADMFLGSSGVIASTNDTVMMTFVIDEIVDSVWDEVNTGATHNVTNSTGRQLRELFNVGIIRANTAQAGGTNVITLDASASSMDGAYDPAEIYITGGTGVGQSRLILEYNGTTKVAVVDRSWKVIPDATSEFSIIPSSGREHVNEGMAQGGGASTITLNTLASSSDSAYIGQLVFIRSGVGDDQVKEILNYNGTTKVATVRGTWFTNPTDSSGYVILPFASTPDVSDIADAVWDEDTTGHLNAGTYGFENKTGGGGSAPTVEQIDTELTANHGAGAWTTGSISGTGSDTINVYAVDTSGVDATVADQFITVKNASGATVITGVTDGTGLKTFFLDPATYTLLGRGTGYEWFSRSLVVSGNSTDTLFGQDLAVGSPAGGDMVRVFGYLKDAGDSAIIGARVEGVRVSSKTGIDTTGVAVIISSTPVVGYSDTLGYWFIDVRKTTSFSADTTKGFYNIKATYSGSTIFDIERFYAPDVSTINLADSLAGR